MQIISAKGVVLLLCTVDITRESFFIKTSVRKVSSFIEGNRAGHIEDEFPRRYIELRRWGKC